MTATAVPPAAGAATIAEALGAILEPGQVTELRALGVPNGYRRATVSGYFDAVGALAAAAANLDQRGAKGVYFIPNPVKPALLARAKNRFRAISDNEPTTSDADILSRRWLLIDCDPVRPAGISSSAEEHAAAIERARAIRNAMAAAGWPAPILADSGNGAHLLFRVDLLVDDGGLVRRCLEALAARFGDERISIDRKVFNPSRIWKLYGTTARKGDDTPERPHRLARLLEVPSWS